MSLIHCEQRYLLLNHHPHHPRHHHQHNRSSALAMENFLCHRLMFDSASCNYLCQPEGKIIKNLNKFMNLIKGTLMLRAH